MRTALIAFLLATSVQAAPKLTVPRVAFEKYEKEPGELATVPLAAVQAAAKKYVVPADSTLLLVGDRSKIEPGVRGLKIGDVVILDAEGR